MSVVVDLLRLANVLAWLAVSIGLVVDIPRDPLIGLAFMGIALHLLSIVLERRIK